MARWHFFCDHAPLLPQPEPSAFGPVDAATWQVTSRFTALSEPNAYAIGPGIVLAQPDGANLLNLVLVPSATPAFLAAPLRAIVYRGIERSSLLEADGVTLRHGEGLLKAVQDSHQRSVANLGAAAAPTGDALGLALAEPPATTIDAVLAADDAALAPYLRPTVAVGAFLGRFAANTIGIEIVVAHPHHPLTLERLRRPAPDTLAVPNLAGLSGDARRFVESRARDALLAYYDPCHFFTALCSNGALAFAGGTPPNLAQWLALWNNSSYVCLDLRNAENRSLNFYHNYGAAPDAPPPVKGALGDAASLTQADYETQGWPLLRLGPAGTDSDLLRLKLPTGHNAQPALHIAEGRQADSGRDLIDPLPVDANDPSFTSELRLHLPRRSVVALPVSLQLRLLRKTLGPAAASAVSYRPPIANRFDEVLDLAALLGDTGMPQPKPPNRSVVHFDRGAAFMRAVGSETLLPARLVVAADALGVYLLARPADRALIGRPQAEYEHGGDVVWQDETVQDVLPLAALRFVPRIFDGQPVTVPDPASLPALGRQPLGIGLAHDEWQALVAAHPPLLDPAAERRLTLAPLGPLADGAAAFELRPFHARFDEDAQVLRVAVPSAASGLPRFYTADADASFMLSSGLVAALGSIQAVEATNRNAMKASYVMADNRVTLRRTPEVIRITAAEWSAAGGNEDALASAQNAIGQVPGDRRVPVTVLGKKRVDGRLWYLVEFLEPTEIITLAGIPSNFAGSPAPIGATVNTLDKRRTLPAGERAWIRREGDSALFPVASYAKFRVDLRALLETLDARFAGDTFDERLTRLRMLTKARTGDSDDTRVARGFDMVIGTIVVSGGGILPVDIEPSVTPAEGLDTIAYESGEQLTVDGENVDTKLQLLADYMGVRLGRDCVIDLHHLFVGLDVMRHRQAPRRITRDMMAYAGGAGIDWGLIDDNFFYTFTDNGHAALWAGDIGVYFTQRSSRSAAEYERDWDTDHPGAANREATFARSYFSRAAPDHDLLTDALAHRMSTDLRRLEVTAMPRVTDALLEAFDALREEIVARGPGAYIRYFFDDLKRGGGNVIPQIDALLVNFSRFFFINKAIATGGPFGFPDLFNELTEVPEGNLPPEIKEAMAAMVNFDAADPNRPTATHMFVEWLEGRGDVKLR